MTSTLTFASDAPPLELLSPFIAPTEDAVPLADLVARQPPSLLKDLLTDPRAVAERMLNPAEAPRTMARTVALLGASSALTGALLASLVGAPLVRAALLLPAAIVLAVGAAMGPVAASAVMAGARVPWQLLSAALTTAVTAGALTLTALVPVSVLAMAIDTEWAGPLTIVFAFAAAGFVSGKRIQYVFEALAAVVCQRTSVTLDGVLLERIRLVGRVALVQLAFTMSIAVWALGVFT